MNNEQLNELNNKRFEVNSEQFTVNNEELNEVNNEQFEAIDEQPHVSNDNQKSVIKTTSTKKQLKDTNVLKNINSVELNDPSSSNYVSLGYCTEVLNVHIDEDFQVPSNTVIATSVKINRSIKNDRDIILSPYVIKDSIAVASVLTNVRDVKIKVQLANLSKNDITVKAGTSIYDG